jgi:SAM-dependent methyltransferase
MEFCNSRDKTPSALDNNYYKLIRKSVLDGVEELAHLFMNQSSDNVLQGLEVAPQEHKILHAFEPLNCNVMTFDIDPDSGADFIGDICSFNPKLQSQSFDFVLCTEVIEHVLKPQDAVDECMRITKKGGFVLFTSPFNFRIHGPLPDNWRISEWGWKTLLHKYKIFSLKAIESPDRDLFPIHYRVIAQPN